MSEAQTLRWEACADKKDVQIMMHACCGPCAEWPVEDLQARDAQMELLYFNPNIHPFAEWQRRLEGLKRFAYLKELDLRVEKVYDEEAWLLRKKDPERCAFCYRVRMNESARLAKERGYDAFSTTLLVSPYQNRQAILKIAFEAAERHGVFFLPEDWRHRFRYGQQLAIEDGLYRQKYCGCAVSLAQSKFLEKIQKQHARYVPLEDSPKIEEILRLKDPARS